MNSIFLLLGGNLGNRQEHLSTAKCFIEQEAGKIQTCSSIYESTAWGVMHQPVYYNQVLKLATVMTAGQLLELLLNIEKKMGRIRLEKYASRIIDIDILFFNNEVYNSEKLVIPHPLLTQRRFALEPLAEIAPALYHPLLHKTVAVLLQECEDPLLVKRI